MWRRNCHSEEQQWLAKRAVSSRVIAERSSVLRNCWFSPAAEFGFFLLWNGIVVSEREQQWHLLIWRR